MAARHRPGHEPRLCPPPPASPGCYDINCADGVWTARYLEDAAVLTATTEPALRALIREDYTPRRADELAALRAEFDAENAVLGPGERALRGLIDDGVI